MGECKVNKIMNVDYFIKCEINETYKMNLKKKGFFIFLVLFLI